MRTRPLLHSGIERGERNVAPVNIEKIAGARHLPIEELSRVHSRKLSRVTFIFKRAPPVAIERPTGGVADTGQRQELVWSPRTA